MKLAFLGISCHSIRQKKEKIKKNNYLLHLVKNFFSKTVDYDKTKWKNSKNEMLLFISLD